jgi:hypothetical protein
MVSFATHTIFNGYKGKVFPLQSQSPEACSTKFDVLSIFIFIFFQHFRSLAIAVLVSCLVGKKISLYPYQRFFCITYCSRNQLYFTLLYSKNTTTYFGPICGPSSGGYLTYRSFIPNVWAF